MNYKIKYVEMTPAEYGDKIENGEEVEYCYVTAEVAGDVDDAIVFWAVQMEFNVIDYEECNEDPELYITEDDWLPHSDTIPF